jgi:hypothetical protein
MLKQQTSGIFGKSSGQQKTGTSGILKGLFGK